MVIHLFAVSMAAQPVTEPLGSGVVVDWSALEIRVSASAEGVPVGSTRAVEELARREADEALHAAARGVRVDCATQLGDWLERADLGPAVDARLSRWTITTSNYDLAGDVELAGELSLLELFKPITLSRAVAAPVGLDPSYTGVIVDARTSSARPHWFPRVVGEDGEVLFDGNVIDSLALDVAPAVWVRDANDPAAARAGARPMILRAPRSSGCTLTLGPEDTVRFRTALSSAPLLRRGALVVVVD